MTSRPKRSSSKKHALLLGDQALRQLLKTLSDAEVSSFSYEDARLKLEIVLAREPAASPDSAAHD